MRTIWLIPILAIVLIGAGCALTKSQGDTTTITTIPEPRRTDEARLVPPLTAPSPNPPNNPPDNPLNNPPPAPRIVQMNVGDFFFDPKSISVKSGETITIVFSGATGHHDFSLDELGIRQPIAAGGSVTITAPTTPGRYAYYCSIGAHRTLGMEGTLVVE